MKHNTWMHIETIAQMVVGTILAQIILACFHIGISEAITMNIVFFVSSYIRTYTIRRAFAALAATAEYKEINKSDWVAA